MKKKFIPWLFITYIAMFSNCGDFGTMSLAEVDDDKDPVINSISLDYSIIFINGSQRDSTRLTLDASDNGEILNITFNTEGSVNGYMLPGAYNNEVYYFAGDLPGSVVFSATVFDTYYNSTKLENAVELDILDSASVKISDTSGSFYGILADNDNFGTSVTAIDYTFDEGSGSEANYNIAVGAPGDNDNGTDQGAVWLVSLNFNNYKDYLRLSPGNLLDGDQFSYSVSYLDDLNGDGVHELIAGAPGDDGGGTDRGALWILFILDTSFTAIEVDDTDIPLLNDNDLFGTSVANIGDVNGDGIPDLAAGAPGDDTGGTDRGSVRIIFLNSNGTVQSVTKIGSAELPGLLTDNEQFGSSVTGIGDFDADGIPDIAVGSPGYDGGGTDRGAIMIINLNSDGTVKGSRKITDTDIPALTDNNRFGSSIAGLTDLNADSVPELIVGAPGNNGGGTGRGALWIVYLNSNFDVTNTQKIDDTEGNFTGILNDNFQLGSSVTSLGDIDGDGFADILTGAPGDNDGGPRRGAVWMMLLSDTGVLIP